jgi:hypothetical protein
MKRNSLAGQGEDRGLRQIKVLIVAAFILSSLEAAEGQTLVPLEEWGGARLFIIGTEVHAPLQFAGMGLPVLTVNDVRIDPLTCAEPRQSNFRGCGAGDQRPANDPTVDQWLRQETFIANLVIVSARPVIAVGCDYVYSPDEGEGERVLAALAAKAYDLAVEIGAPKSFVEDYRRQAD